MTSAYEILAQLKRTASGPMTEARGAEPAFYWNEEVASAEENAIFRHDWVCPGLASEIPDVGDYLTFSIAGEPVLRQLCQSMTNEPEPNDFGCEGLSRFDSLPL